MSCLGLSAAASHRSQLYQYIYIHTGAKMTRGHLFSLCFFQYRLHQSPSTIPSFTTPCVFNTHSNLSMYNLSKTPLNMSLDLFRAYHFLALLPLSTEKKNTPSSPTHQWFPAEVIFSKK